MSQFEWVACIVLYGGSLVVVGLIIRSWRDMRRHPVSDAKRALSIFEFQRYGADLQAAQTPEEVQAACDAYEQRKRELWA